MTSATADLQDPGHLLSIDEWEDVVQRAERIVAGAERSMLTLGRSSFGSVTGFVQARWHGAAQTPTYGVLHDAETPLSNGYAASIARMFSTTTTQKSAHFMVDPAATFQLLDTGLTAWHCGNGNRRSIGVEQAGYAAFSRAQWMTADGIAQMNRVAALMQDIKRAHGIGLYWMTDQQLLNAYNGAPGGWATHDQCRRVLKGTTHTDPQPNYPFADVMSRANGGVAPAPQPPAPVPAGAPSRLGWPFTGQHRFGNWMNPSALVHGGNLKYDSQATHNFVANIQAWLIYKGCVPGVTNWKTSGWDDGLWEGATDEACIRWHARFYPNQKLPKEIWSDDYSRLAVA